MRERLARVTAIVAVLLLGGLAAAFARAQNPRGAETAGPTGTSAEARAPASSSGAATAAAPAPAAPDSARGHAVFLAQGCARCHSVAGAGSQRVPLDGVGARRSAASLRAWTTGAASLADSLPPSTLRTKQAFAKLPPADLDALVSFLSSLKQPR